MLWQVRRGLITGRGALDAAASSLDAATTAWVAAVVTAGGTVSAPRQAIVDTFIKALKAASLWKTDTDGLDRYWLYAGEDAGSAGIDLVNLQPVTLVGAPTFSANNGYAAVNSSNYVDTNFIPSSSGVNHTLNRAVFGGQVQTNRIVGANVINCGAANTAFTNHSTLGALNGSNNAGVSVNAGSEDAFASTTARGSWIASRTALNAGALYYNGSTTAPGGTFSTSSSGLPDVSFFIGSVNIGGSVVADTNDVMSSFFVAGGWDGTQAAAFEAAQNAMMTSIGGGLAVH